MDGDSDRINSFLRSLSPSIVTHTHPSTTVFVPFPYTNEQIAEIVGCTRESVSRLMLPLRSHAHKQFLAITIPVHCHSHPPIHYGLRALSLHQRADSGNRRLHPRKREQVDVSPRKDGHNRTPRDTA